jgi:hypothetical protein
MRRKMARNAGFLLVGAGTFGALAGPLVALLKWISLFVGPEPSLPAGVAVFILFAVELVGCVFVALICGCFLVELGEAVVKGSQRAWRGIRNSWKKRRCSHV